MAPRLSVSYSFSTQVAYNHLKLQAEEPNALLLAPAGTHKYMVYTHIQIHTYTHTKISILLFKKETR